MARIELDWNEYLETAAAMVAEGQVLLENRDNILPLKKGSRVSIFGRIQTSYYKSGTGSGGMVNVASVVTIPEGLRRGGIVELNEKLYKTYADWELSNPFDEGHGWGTEPWSQEEMPITDELVNEAREFSDIAIVIIGRTAGEDKDIKDEPGAYRLSEVEQDMLAKVRKAYDKMIVVLNICSLMDISFVDTYKPEGLLLAWTGGMVGGEGTARVLDGRVCPSGRLTDTIAYRLQDYPSYEYFGDGTRNYYKEDIYVGYRYFETFNKAAVRYPFGYGLSYTKFDILPENSCVNDADKRLLKVSAEVVNKGDMKGKQVVMVYASCPQGKLGKPEKVLVGFAKTGDLEPGERERVNIEVRYSELASYDDLGVTGHKGSWVMEPGTYDLYVGADVRNCSPVAGIELEELLVVEELVNAMPPVLSFERLVNRNGEQVYENVPAELIDEAARREEELPAEIEQTSDRGYKLRDVADNKVSMKDFIAQMTDEDLINIIRGEGMGSSLVTPGTAAAFGGVSPRLRDMGVPSGCCDDGPSGMRLDSGVRAFSLPCGLLIASSYNVELVEKLYSFTSGEMAVNKVECLLGPGMNIHRHPLNGRNFEYFSEDPYLTGCIAIANLKGLKKYGAEGTVKHFCANNQEYARVKVDAVISERALREIYLKGFELAVKYGNAKSVMTTYGAVNGLWTAGNYGLNKKILRDQWGFDGIVMTDWWAAINNRGEAESKSNFAAMVRAENDLYMVVPDSKSNGHGDNLEAELKAGRLTRGELQRSAANICGFLINTEAYRRINDMQDEIVIINRYDDDDMLDSEDTEYLRCDDEITISLDSKLSKAGVDYQIPLDMNTGYYEVTVTGKCNLQETAQVTCTLYYTGVPFNTFTFNGSNGNSVSVTKNLKVHNRMAVFRLHVAKNGLVLERIHFKRTRQID